jgi:hypothetical protein
MSVVRNGGTGTAVVGIGRTGERGRAVARPDTVFNRQHPLGLTLLQRSCHAHAANRVPVNFRLLKVTTTKGSDTVELDKRKIPAQRVAIKGDFAATVWFDQNRNFVMAELPIAGRKVLVKRDPS